jgi:hypothetical protein
MKTDGSLQCSQEPITYLIASLSCTHIVIESLLTFQFVKKVNKVKLSLCLTNQALGNEGV